MLDEVKHLALPSQVTFPIRHQIGKTNKDHLPKDDTTSPVRDN
jgi:hypothetical protein